MNRLLIAAIGVVMSTACGPTGTHAPDPPNVGRIQTNLSERGGIVRLFGPGPDRAVGHPAPKHVRPVAGRYLVTDTSATRAGAAPALDSLELGV